ncbi:MAG TPA: hypothetical protein VF062_02380 [Candidatus Limnocylindrales bacterium]
MSEPLAHRYHVLGLQVDFGGRWGPGRSRNAGDLAGFVSGPELKRPLDSLGVEVRSGSCSMTVDRSYDTSTGQLFEPKPATWKRQSVFVHQTVNRPCRELQPHLEHASILDYRDKMIDSGLTVTFSRDQALVLSDWLDGQMGTARFDGLVNEDPAVWSPIYRLAGSLETRLPEIFAPDYGERLDAARRRLQIELGSGVRPVRPVRQRSVAEREVLGWVHEDAAQPVMRHLSDFVGHRFDSLDETAMVGALDGTEATTDDRWFEYPLEGRVAVTVRMARKAGNEMVAVVVRGTIDEVLEARIETLLALLASDHG